MTLRLLIVDANVAADVFGKNSDYDPVRAALFNARRTTWGIAHGGRLTDELLQVEASRRALASLEKVGRTKTAARQDVEHVEDQLRSESRCVSNDLHVIAVGKLTGARLLCTRDQALASDFTNPKLLSGPRGKVYHDRSHEHLLRTR